MLQVRSLLPALMFNPKSFKMEAYKTIEHKGYEIDLVQDEVYDTPNDWDGTDIFLVSYARDLSFPRDGYNDCNEARDGLKKEYHIFPVRAYIHGGIALSLDTNYPFNCQWDSCWIGFIAVIKKQYNKQKAQEVATGTLETWNDLLSGNVWGYVIKKDNEELNDVGSAVWGFYGDPEGYCLDEAKSHINYLVQENIKTHFTRVKAWIKNRVPFQHRKQFAV